MYAIRSYYVPWLKENYSLEVIAVCINVGQEDDMEEVKVKAIESVITSYSIHYTKLYEIEVLSQDYIRMAKAKGLPQVKIISRHCIRNAIMPVVTYLGPLIAAITTGSFVIEKVFAIPGLGRYFVQSISDRDYTVTLGIVVFYSFLLIVMMLTVDILYGILDPRIV